MPFYVLSLRISWLGYVIHKILALFLRFLCACQIKKIILLPRFWQFNRGGTRPARPFGPARARSFLTTVKEAQCPKMVSFWPWSDNFSLFGPKVIQKNEGKKLKFYDIAYLRYHIPYSGYDVKFFGDNGLWLRWVYVITAGWWGEVFGPRLLLQKFYYSTTSFDVILPAVVVAVMKYRPGGRWW